MEIENILLRLKSISIIVSIIIQTAEYRDITIYPEYIYWKSETRKWIVLPFGIFFTVLVQVSNDDQPTHWSNHKFGDVIPIDSIL